MKNTNTHEMKPTLLLHGALGTLEELNPLSNCLSTELNGALD